MKDRRTDITVKRIMYRRTIIQVMKDRRTFITEYEGQKDNYLNGGRTEGQLLKCRKDRRAII